MTSTQITIPVSPDVFWPIVGLLALISASAAIALLLPRDGGKSNARGFDALTEKLGFSRGWVGPLLFGALVLSLIFVTSLLELAKGIFFGESFNADRFGIFAAIVTAFFTGAFLAWRNILLSKQAAIQDQALFNDKINAASEDLAARRQVTRVLFEGTPKELIVTEWKDDLVRRAAAIDRLHGLAQERPEVTSRVARQLSIYVRELSNLDGTRPKSKPEGVDAKGLQNWIDNVLPVRPDMQQAVRVLGQLQKIKGHCVLRGDIDLSHANLQAFNLRDLNLDNAILLGAFMERSFLARSSFFDADLWGAYLSGASIYRTNLSGAELGRAELRNSRIFWASFTESTSFSGAKLEGSALIGMNAEDTQRLRPFWDSVFADKTVEISENDNWPSHWSDKNLTMDLFDEAWAAWRDTLPNDV